MRSATAPESVFAPRNSARVAPFSPGSPSAFSAYNPPPDPDRTIRRGPSVNDSVASLSIVSLFWHADIVVKGVLLLLLAASVWSWAVILDKLWRLVGARRSAQTHEARVAAAHSAPELMTPSGRSGGADPAEAVLSAGWIESAQAAWPTPET